MNIVPENLVASLEKAGWFEGRRVPVDLNVPVNHPAYRVLAEFGGLQLIRDEIVEFDFQHVTEGSDQIEPWAEALKVRLVGVAEAHNGHGALYMTDGGHVIGCSLIHDACWFEGKTIEEAIANVLTGTRSRPMLLPCQSEVKLYGEVFQNGDSAVVTPTSPELQQA